MNFQYLKSNLYDISKRDKLTIQQYNYQQKQHFIIWFIIMTEYLLYLRKNKGICQKISINPSATISQLKSRASSSLNIIDTSFQLNFKNIKISQQKTDCTIAEYGIPNNSIVQVIIPSKQSNDQLLEISLQNGQRIQNININKSSTVAQLRDYAAHLFNITPNSFDFSYRGGKIFENQRKLSQLQIHKGDSIVLKSKHMIKSLLEAKQQSRPPNLMIQQRLNFVQSIPSQQDNNQQIDMIKHQQSPFYKGHRSDIVKKHISLTSSQRKIEQATYDTGKKSQIMTSSARNQFINSPNIRKTNKLMDLNEIKQTISFGSLQQDDPIQTQIQLYNEDCTKYYKIICLRQSTGLQLRKKLAKVERLPLQNIEIQNLDDELILDNLQKNLDNQITLIYRVES